MKKNADIGRRVHCILGICIAAALSVLGGCGGSGGDVQEMESSEENLWEDEITIMHNDGKRRCRG